MANALITTELDFDLIKIALQNYLKGQDQFSDYNFDGSALSVLLDVLSYNTHYSSVLVNLMANEMFLDSAIKRSSVLSIAKTLGYIPRSTSSAVATLTLVVTPTDITPPATLTIDPSVTFSTTVNNTPYTFRAQDTLTVPLTNGVYTFSHINVVEGTSLSNSFTITSDLLQGPLPLPVSNIDTSTLLVAVQNSSSDMTTTIFTQASTVVDVDDTTTLYWVEEIADGTYQLVFGDGILGQSLVTGNIVTASYLASNGPDANGASMFSLNGAIGGETNVSIQLINQASAGGAKEDIDTIRFNAPKFNATKNRVVTAHDYQALILANTPNAQSVVVWGGEDNIPPIYGTVFITLDPKEGYVITDTDKNNILDTVLKPRSVMGIVHTFVDPEFIYLGFTVTITYDPRKTNYSATDLTALVNTQIQTYFSTNMATLDKTFFFSQFSDSLSNLSPAILGTLIDMHLQRRISQSASFNTTQNLQFLASLEAGTVTSTIFVSTVNGTAFNAYLQDFPNDSIPNPNGFGTIKLLDSKTNAVLVPSIGTVNYGTGTVTISNLNITTYLGNATSVAINAVPTALSRNITTRTITATATSTGAVIPVPSRNIILDLDDSVLNGGINLTAGVTINTIPYIPSN